MKSRPPQHGLAAPGRNPGIDNGTPLARSVSSPAQRPTRRRSDADCDFLCR